MSKPLICLPDLSTRANIPELMDDPHSDPRLLANTLGQFRLINLLFSPVRRLLKKQVLKSMMRAPQREHHLVDLGAGSCETAVWLLSQARRKGLRMRITACDHDPRVIQYAKNKYGHTRYLTICQRNVFDIDDLQPIDFVFANHLVHHLSDADIHRLLGALARLKETKVIISDLHRSRLVYTAFYLISAVFFRRSFVRYDGLLSVRKAFTEPEFNNIMQAAVPRSTVYQIKRMFPGHIVLLLETPSQPD